jgi:hypothetical protein
MDLAKPSALAGRGLEGDEISAEPQILEMSIMLPSWQVAALDSLARRQGQNVGQMLRRVISALVLESLPAVKEA